MICQWADIVFEGLKSFGGFSTVDEALYAEHELLNTKSVLQPTGQALKQGNITIMLRQDFCVVKDELSKLYGYLASNKVGTLLWGDSRIEGDFVITTIEKTDEYVLPDGSLVQCSLNIGLKEWFVPDKLVQQQQDARNNAAGVGDKKPPVKTGRSNASNCSQQVSLNMSTIESRGAEADKYARKYDSNTIINTIMLSDCRIINAACDKLTVINNTAGSCTASIQADVTIKITGVKNESSELSDVVTNLSGNRFFYGDNATGVLHVQQVNDVLQAAIKALKTTLTPIINNSVTRQPDFSMSNFTG